MLKAPFPYFGGKSLASKMIWEHFGDVDNYIEPFFGSGAVLLNSPNDITCTVNDINGFVVNFWRAIQADPYQTAYWADNPVYETDLLARHIWLVNQSSELLKKIQADPDYYDCKVAGWWAWGASCWIGTGWCDGKGAWNVNEDGTDVFKMDKNRNKDKGCKSKILYLTSKGTGLCKTGVQSKIPLLGHQGQGVNKTGFSSDTLIKGKRLEPWFEELSLKLRKTRVVCGDWKRITTKSVTKAHGISAVFLDPPYTKGDAMYETGETIPNEVRQWCIENAQDTSYRIAVCGHDGEHDELLEHGFYKEHWKANRGFDTKSTSYQEETIWFSASCSKENNTLHLI